MERRILLQIKARAEHAALPSLCRASSITVEPNNADAATKSSALEDIADLVGHRGTATTETVYRKVIVPELRRGAEVMDRLFT